MLDWLREHFDVSCDWPQLWGKWNWQTFRFVHGSVEIDSILGQFVLEAAFLGFGIRYTLVFDPDTQVRRDLADMSWLETACVSLSYKDYKELQDAQDELRRIKGEARAD